MIIRMMSEIDSVLPLSPSSPSPPPPPPQKPTATTIFSQSSKMQKDICFYCGKPGHWARACPSKTPEKSSPSSSRGGPTKSSEYPLIDCPCGNGTCPIMVSKTVKNPDRSFYTCPVQGSGKCPFFKWCDEIKVDDTMVRPKCTCGAGTCRKLIEVKEPNVGRGYFVCPIKKGLGACPFFEWADTRSYKDENVNVDKSKGYSSPQSMCDSHKVFDVLSNDLQTEQHERMELIVSNPQDFSNSEAVSTSSAQAYLLLKENQDSDRTSGDLFMRKIESWDSIRQKASVVCLMSQYDIHCRQMKFWKQMSDAKGISTAGMIYLSLGILELGWLGRLAFPPPRCLRDHPPSPFFCGIFPSYDPIFVPKDRNILNPEGSTHLPSQSLSNGEHDNLLSPIPGQDLQLWNGDILKPSASGLKRSSTTVEDDNVRSFDSGLISKFLQETVLHLQNQLVIILNSMDPSNYDSMKEAGRLYLPLLDGTPINNDSFSGHVKQFIDSATRLSAIEKSICNEQSLQECSELYNSEKVYFDDISKAHEKAVSDFTSASKHLQSLREQASHLRNMLRKIEDKLLHCEAETSELKTHVYGINGDMLESKRRMQKAEEALKLCKQREEERLAAKATLEEMRVQLQRHVGSMEEVCSLPLRKRQKL